MMSEPRKGTAIVIGGGFGGEIRSGIPQVIFAIFTENGPESPALLRRGGMGVACLGLARWGIGWIIPRQEGINGSPYQFRYRHAFPLRSHMKTFQRLFS